MKKILSFLITIIIIINILLCCGINVSAAENSAVFSINAGSGTGKKIGNVVGYMNSWGYENLRNLQTDGETDISFVDYVEIMTATGGSAERDLIDENGNMIVSKLDALAQACQGILNIGAKPLLKLGCIPFYFSMKSNPNKVLGDVFGFNTSPPDNDKYEEYQLYIENVIQYMIDRFGIDEVRSWRFGVMTEYENDEWFYVLNSRGKVDVNATKEAFFKIYDYSVQALENKLGKENVYVGAHSMTVTEGCWDERSFIDHVANGYNYANGTYSGAQIDYLSFSFYDSNPNKYTSGMTLSQCVNFLRDYAVSKGLDKLQYGIDEGRVLSGVNSGHDSDALNTRSVGHIWQAGYDARMYKTMLDSDIDYFCVWSYTSDTIGTGYPAISYHVANSMSKMVGDERINVSRTSANLASGLEAETFASYNKDSKTTKILSYNFKNNVTYHDPIDMQYNITVPELADKAVKVKRYLVDYSATYFDEWWADREKYGITDDKFMWSPDDPSIDSPVTLSDSSAREFYYSNLRDKYKECAKLTPTEYVTKLDSNGSTSIQFDSLSGNGVVFYEISPADEFDSVLYKARSLNPNDYMDFSAMTSLLLQADKMQSASQSEKDAYINELETAMQGLIKNKRTGISVSLNKNETNYPYAYLFCELSLVNADFASSATYASKEDAGSMAYMLDGNDTYDQNNFHVWNRTYQLNSGPKATYYVDRYSCSDLSQLGNIINVDYTTWGRNHQHSIGIAGTGSKLIDGGSKTVVVTGSKGNYYEYSISDTATGSQYSSGSESSFLYTPDSELIKTHNSGSVKGRVPKAGESVTVRIGARTSVIDGYGWGNLLNYYCWTDVTFIAYDSTPLRMLVTDKIENENAYTKSSFENYKSAYQNAVNVLNYSYTQSEIDSAAEKLESAVYSLVPVNSILRGDVNLDLSCDGMDAVIVNCIIAGMLEEADLSEIQFIAADADSNGNIDENDSLLLEKRGLKL